ncbi:MAG: S41 family peptidase [Bacteroidales bacterium]|nr:S41 family peptidase [Bacteroidales bacterium]
MLHLLKATFTPFTMGRKLFFILMLVLYLITGKNLYGQTTYYSWPINSSEAKIVLCAPQQSIEGETNLDNLFIGGPENTPVLCPADGKIINIGYCFLFSLEVISYIPYKPLQQGKDIAYTDSVKKTEICAELRQQLPDKPVDRQYVSLMVRVQTKNKDVLTLVGLRPVKYFKTGDMVKQGDTLGRLGYSYSKIKKPSIMLSRSISGKPADPMSVFNIKTSFVKNSNNPIDYKTHKHTAQELVEAFHILKQSLTEGHPGLYDYSPKPIFDSICTSVSNQLTRPMTSEEFRKTIWPVITSIKDNHTALYPFLYEINDNSKPPFELGVVEGKLIILSATREFSTYINREVASVNGIDAQLLIDTLERTIDGADGYIQTYNTRALMNHFMKYFRWYYQANSGYKLHLTLKNGEEITGNFTDENNPQPPLKYIPDKQENISCNFISDDIAYIKISTFSLLQSEEDQVKSFIKKIAAAKTENLIVDVRFNYGGSSEVMYRMFSLISDLSAICPHGYNKVNSNSKYGFFKHTMNFSNVEGLFPDYQQAENKEGYYKKHDPELLKKSVHQVSDSIRFDKNVFVLVNEYSFSAAAEFAGLVLSCGRGKIIGRETPTAFYQINAVNFAEVLLGKTGLLLRVPLVKVVFTDKVIERIPVGRGIIPDYIVPPSVEEAYSETDKIMASAIEIIENKLSFNNPRE